MYEYIRGVLAKVEPTKAVIDVSGVGYHLLIPLNVYNELCLLTQKQVTLYCSFVVREDSQRLFGFLDESSRNLFLTLSDVSGIGPKTALSILGHMSIDELKLALHHSDSLSLSKVPGIGKKTAARLIVELKDKVGAPEKEISLKSIKGPSSTVQDAISALIHLGYQRSSAEKAVKMATNDGLEIPPLSELISKALKCT